MAQRRMFSLKIVASDAFLDMPTSTRELYFQLGMYADDDGFVNPKKVVRLVGASDDDMKLLIAKRFVLPFENGVVVIKHWLINNLIRKDFYQPTIYSDEKKRIFTKENKAYTDCLQNVNNLETQDRLGKDRLGNNGASAQFTFKDTPMPLDWLNDGDVTYEEIDAKTPKKYKNKRKLYARVVVHYMQLTSKTGNVLRYFKDAKELVEMAEKIYSDETRIEQEIIARVNVAAKYYNKNNIKLWSLGKIVENWDIILNDWRKEVE